MSRSHSVRDALLQSALFLFSRKGYAAVSMREIAKSAGANVGSLTYHFGSKANLVREIYLTHSGPMNERRLEMLREACRIEGHEARLTAIIRAYVIPAFSMSQSGIGGGAEFTRMRAILSAEGNSEAAEIIADSFDETSLAFIKAIQSCIPGVSYSGLIWRSQFLLGSLYYALINPDRVTRISGGQVDGHDHEAAIDHLVGSAVASFLLMRQKNSSEAA